MDAAVIVVGAGPVGLAVACALRLRGVDVLVLEALDAPAPTARASHVHGRVMEVLDGLGVADALVARGRPTDGARIFSGGRLLSATRSDAVPTRFPYSLAVPQPEVEEVLAMRLGELGGRVLRGARVQRVAEADGVVLTGELAGIAHEWRAAWVVGCDGASSPVRESLGLGLVGTAVDAPLMLADFDLPVADRLSEALLYAGADGIVFRVPLRDGERVVVELPAGVEPSPEALIAAANARVPGLPAFGVPRWWSKFRLHRLVAPTWRKGRVMLAGDAAHLHSPIGGHGMNTGLLDAAHLGWRLAAVVGGHASAEILDQWADERRPAAASSVLEAWMAAHVLRIRRPPLRWLRDWAMRAGEWVPVLRRRIARWAIAFDADATGIFGRLGWLPEWSVGTRAPDVRVGPERWRLDGKRGRWLLISVSVPESVREAVAKRVGEPVEAVLAPIGADIALVRPDGLVAWRGPADRVVAAVDGLLGRP
jgi:2-polyprenyl-6-methoxyphenol hydroxylase-like FAD-dependent oxidoreductase